MARSVIVPVYCHSRAAGMAYLNHWIPAFAGMTEVARIKTIVRPWKVGYVCLSLRRHYQRKLAIGRRAFGELSRVVVESRLPATGRSGTGGRGILGSYDAVLNELRRLQACAAPG